MSIFYGTILYRCFGTSTAFPGNYVHPSVHPRYDYLLFECLFHQGISNDKALE
jgi:hypothetical protein